MTLYQSAHFGIGVCVLIVLGYQWHALRVFTRYLKERRENSHRLDRSAELATEALQLLPETPAKLGGKSEPVALDPRTYREVRAKLFAIVSLAAREGRV